jgi:hypothetical protein
MNRSHVVTAIVLSMSTLAALLAGMAWLDRRPAAEAASLRRIEDRLAALAEGLDRSGEVLAALARRVDGLAAAGPRGEGAADASSGASEAGDAASGKAEPVRAIVERLEGIAAKLEHASAAQPALIGGSGQPGIVMETPEDRARIVEENRPIAMDPGRPFPDRLEALRHLRSRDGRSREVVHAMMELIETPDLDPRMRADIIRNLDGVDFPELKEPLLRILATDPHVETLSETIETLQAFYGDPAVHAAVVHVRDNAENIRVRMEALERLSQYDEVKARLEKAQGR